MKKIIKAVAWLLFIAILGCAVINAVVIFGSLPYMSEGKDLPAGETTVMIPGSGVFANQPGTVLRSRLDRAIELYKDGRASKLLMSGDGQDQYYNEVEVMVNYAIENGVDKKDILTDPEGFSTYVSVYNTSQRTDIDRLVIVSQRYHLYRAVYIARHMGLNARGVSCDDTFVPYQSAREFAARIKDFYYTVSKTAPDKVIT